VSGYTWAWLAWGAAFLVIEAKAIRDGADGKSGGTLSEHLRAWLGTTRKSSRGHRIVGITGLLLLVAWFVPHIITEG
jgi:hypothetical protein